MRLLKELDQEDLAEVGRELHRFAAELYPICRSITGDGIRQTLASIQKRIPLQIFEVPTGTTVFDWTVPKEWNIRDAYIKDRQREAGRGFSAVQPARHELQHARACDHAAERTQAASVHTSRASGLDSVPDVLLPGELGILPVAQPDAGAGGRRVRGMHRLNARRWTPDLWRVLFAGQIDRRGSDLVPCLPSIAGQRQSFRADRGDLPGAASYRGGIFVTRIASCSFRERSAPSPGWRETGRPSGASATGWC